MKKMLLAIFSAMLLAANANAAIDAKGAENFIKNVTKEGIEDIINANVSKEEKDARFYKLFNENLDLNKIGQFVLGRYWRGATAEQRKDFINVYRELNIKTWSARFDEFKGKKFVFEGTSSLNSKNSQNQVFVNTSVPMDNAAPAKVVWRVEEKGGKYKVVDIIIENVSLAISARNEYTSYIQKSPDGLNGLIKSLQVKLKTM